MNIIFNTLEQLQSDKLYGLSKDIEITKGKNKIKNIKEKKEKIKRDLYYFLFKIKDK